VIVLDTHAWIWWTSAPERLSPDASAALGSATTIGVSAISAWEVAMLEERGRIELDRPVDRWVHDALRLDGRIRRLDLTVDIALRAAQLGRRGMHGDPVDRFIYATAQDRRAMLVTRDDALRRFDPAGTTW
jgi:PIN domain nuclease of toxin-antitoxin system